MSSEVDKYGRFVDPAEGYQQFMLGLYDLEADARDEAYSPEAITKLREARLIFLAEFKTKYPGYGSGRAIWE